MKKVPTVPNLAMKDIEIVLASKQKLYTLNQKELKLLVTKNHIAALVDKNLRKLFVISFKFIISFFLDKKYNVMLHLAVTFQGYQIY